jgi:hypothetical protein
VEDVVSITRPESVDLAAAQRLIELVHGTWQTHVVAAMAELELADQLSAGPRPVAELAEQAAANPDALERLLRACAALGLVHETGPAGYALTRLGACLRSGQSSLRDLALVAAAPVMLRPYERLTEAVRTGAPTAVAALGQDVWSYARDHPQEALWFAGAMSGLSALVAAELPNRVDLSGVRHVVDVGGGHGLLLTALLDAAPGAVGTLFDLRRPSAGRARRMATGPELPRRPPNGGRLSSRVAPHPPPACGGIVGVVEAGLPALSHFSYSEEVSHVLFTVLGPLIFGEVLVGSHQPKDLPAWSLEVEVRIRHVKYFDAEGDNVLPHFVDVVGLQLQVDRLQALALAQRDGLVLVQERDIGVVPDAKVILPITLSRDLATEHVAVETTNSARFYPRDSNRQMVSQRHLCHDHSSASLAIMLSGPHSSIRGCCVGPATAVALSCRSHPPVRGGCQ